MVVKRYENIIRLSHAEAKIKHAGIRLDKVNQRMENGVLKILYKPFDKLMEGLAQWPP
jgi:hypothetical protein